MTLQEASCNGLQDAPIPTTMGCSNPVVCSSGLSRGPPGLSDVEVAMALQMEELEEARKERQSARSNTSRRSVTTYVLSDPVWGDLKFREHPPGCCDRILFGCCPCVSVGCNAPLHVLFCRKASEVAATVQPKRACKKFWLSFSVLISIAQVLIFIFVVVDGGGIISLEDNPMIGPHAHVLDRAGAKNAAKIRYSHEWWRLLTPLLLHGGIIHLLTNILVQLRFAIMVEVLWGSIVWMVIYGMTGVVANVISCIALPNHISVGSSGSVCGLIGAEIVFILITWRQTLPRDAMERNLQLASLIFTAILTAAISFLPLVDFAAHGGGFGFGIALGLALFANRLVDSTPKMRILCRIVGCIAAGAMILGSVLYFMIQVEPDRTLLDLCMPPDCR